MNNNYVAIMAGGVGSRFWPSSRSAKPKQFLDILGVGKTLLQLTFERHLKVCPPENIFIVTNEIYRELVKEQLPQVTDNQILGEPSRNNTAPCLAYTALKLQALNPEANFVVASSDHIILKEEAYTQSILHALDFTANHDALVTLGIQPTRPDTGYGYINYARRDANGDGLFKVKQFTEKPKLEAAEAFIASGDYVWNAGIFIWKAKNLIKAFRANAPDILTVLEAGALFYNTPAEQEFINANYPNTPNISIDYAIMEKADNIYTIPADLGWSDLGTWGSLYTEAEKDDGNNVVNANNTIFYNTSNCLIKAPKDKLIIIKDLEDYVIVDEDDVLIIFPKSKEQEIKQIVGDVGKLKGEHYL
jgi:mannose-1-phosphate guanylyltransferase